MHTANTTDAKPTLTKQFWRKTPLALKIFVPGLAALTLLAMSGQPPAVTPPPAPEPPRVSVITAQAEQHRLNIKTQGTVAPRREINLVAQVGGEVISVERNFVDGGHFQARQMLIQIDPSDYQFTLAERRARLAKARELLASERGRAHQAKREWRDLGNESANQLFLRKPQLASAQAEVTAAKAPVDPSVTAALGLGGQPSYQNTLVDIKGHVMNHS